jgi:tetratricopeptide (TPR) repeat protein
LRYLGLLFFPIELSHDRSFAEIPLQSIGSPLAMLSIALHAGLAVFAMLRWRSRQVLSFCILFYFVTLAPVSNLFVLIGSTMAERFLYIPSIGFCLAIAWLLGKLADQAVAPGPGLRAVLAGRALPMGIVVIITAPFGAKAIARNGDWANNYSLFSADVQHAPRSARTHLNLAVVLIHDSLAIAPNSAEKQGIASRARAQLEQARNILPDYHDVDKELAYLFFYTNEPARTVDRADAYLRVDANKADVFNIKGCGLYQLARYEEAADCFRKAVERDRDYKDAYRNLGQCYGNMASYDKAIESFEQCLRLDPNDAQCRSYLALCQKLKSDSATVGPREGSK